MYGTISGTSIGALFVAGVIPGIIMGVIMMALVFIYALIRKYPRDRVGSKRELLHACKEGFLPCMTPVIILLGIYTGIFTPTESAAIVVVYAAILGILVYREINFREFVDVLKETVADAIGICILISAATLFGNVLVKAMIPQTVMEFIVNSINNKYAVSYTHLKGVIPRRNWRLPEILFYITIILQKTKAGRPCGRTV